MHGRCIWEEKKRRGRGKKEKAKRRDGRSASYGEESAFVVECGDLAGSARIGRNGGVPNRADGEANGRGVPGEVEGGREICNVLDRPTTVG